jgi:AraC-like DNA-binding protein
MSGYAFYPVRAELAEVVEAIWHADFPDAEGARSMVLPVVSPIICFHYRCAPLMRLESLGSEQRLFDPGRYRITGMNAGTARLQASGPVGGVMVRLRPEGAARLRGVSVRELAEAAFALSDVFAPAEVSRVDERLLEANDGDARVGVVQQLLIDRLGQRRPDALVAYAARRLRRQPSLPVGELATQLDVSERHLSRRFREALGASPKRFARIARINAVLSAARGCRDWAEIAGACGFSDQAHMINDFTAMVGMPPDKLFQRTSLAQDRKARLSAPESDFFNTFVAEASSRA